MVLVNTHPDYMNFDGKELALEEFPAKYYEDLLVYLKNEYTNLYWHSTPKEVSRFWMSHYPRL